MHNLSPLTPLGQRSAQIERIGNITITEVTDIALASVACRLGQDAAFAKAAKTLFGTSMPGPGTSMSGKVYGLHWTGPDQWFVEADFADHELIAAELKGALGTTASVTEQTDGWARFRVEGAGVVDLLQRLCPIDSAMMQASQVTRTMIEHLGCLVICREAGTEFDILCPRSGAASLLHALTGSAKSIA